MLIIVWNININNDDRIKDITFDIILSGNWNNYERRMKEKQENDRIRSTYA